MTDKERDQIISALTDYCNASDECPHCPISNELNNCAACDWEDMTDEQLAIAAQAAGIDKAPQPDMVNNPNHYQLPGGLECWDVMVAMFGADEVKIWAKINAFTYLFRHKKKNGEEDIRKALVNLEKYFELGADK
jgi:hypothetical protein